MSQTEKTGSVFGRLRKRFHLPANARDLKEWMLLLPDNPHEIAMGLSIGVFISFTPLIPFHMAMAVGLAALFNGSKLTALTGTYLSNPITIPLQYFAAYWTGSLIWRYPIKWSPHELSLTEILDLGWEFALEMVTGGFINGLPFAVMTYFLTREIIVRIKKKKEKRKKTSVA